jgi:threonine dehydratase
LQDILDAAARIRPFARLTPIIDAAGPAGAGAGERTIGLKCENLQRSGAFKMRGAVNMLLQLTEGERARGVITFSSGNHGIALSLAAKLLGVRAVVVMPTTAPAIKVEGARGLGAEIIFEGTTTIERKARTEAEAAARGLTIVPPFDHAWIAAGQGTIGLEILHQEPDADTIFVPCSGGGLLSGVASAIKLSRPDVRVVGVEPTGAARMAASLRAGHPVTLDHTFGIADGLLAVRPGDLTFRHIQAHVDAIVSVDDGAIGAAVAWIFDHGRMVAEPSGAASVAAAMGLGVQTWSRHGHDLQADSWRRAIAVVSGGNVEAAAFGRYITSSRGASTRSRRTRRPVIRRPRGRRICSGCWWTT